MFLFEGLFIKADTKKLLGVRREVKEWRPQEPRRRENFPGGSRFDGSDGRG